MLTVLQLFYIDLFDCHWSQVWNKHHCHCHFSHTAKYTEFSKFFPHLIFLNYTWLKFCIPRSTFRIYTYPQLPLFFVHTFVTFWYKTVINWCRNFTVTFGDLSQSVPQCWQFLPWFSAVNCKRRIVCDVNETESSRLLQEKSGISHMLKNIPYGLNIVRWRWWISCLNILWYIKLLLTQL